MLTAVTACPDCVTVAFQALLIVWLPPNVHLRVQLLIAVELVLLMVTVAVKPLPQSLRTYPTVQPAPLDPVDDGEVDGERDGDVDGEPDGDEDGERETVADADGEVDAGRDAVGLVDSGGLPPLLFTMNAECDLNTDSSGAPCLTL
jgi:hypothetical protein